MRKVFKWIVSGIYGLVMMELVIMISPFAAYWYALYAPTLQGLHRARATAWLDSFFLPHAVITTSPVLEFLRWQVGVYSVSVGCLGFLVCAIQVYGLKFLRRGVAHTWIYSSVRHPQYLFLGIAGFGLMTMWPRMIILVLYAGMLIIYYFLARLEERQMEVKYADYGAYRQRTPMFLPGNPGGRLFRALFGWIPNRRAALAASSALVIVLVIGCGLLVRRYTLAHVAKQLLPEDRTLAIAVWPMPSEEIRQVVSAALSDGRVRSALDKESGAVFTAHILPSDYGMVGMFAGESPGHGGSDRLPRPHHWGIPTMGSLLKCFLGFACPCYGPHRSQIMGTAREDYKVIFSRVDGPDHRPVPVSAITGLEAKMTPVVIIYVGPTIGRVTVPPRLSSWGDITMPMF